MDKKLIKLAEQYGCNNVRYLAERKSIKYYAFERLDDDGNAEPIGLPIIATKDGVLNEKQAASFLDWYNTRQESATE